MAKSLDQYKRRDISFFEGINNSVSSHLARPQEFKYAQNARSKKMGVAEKREGYRRLGSTAPTATANYGIFDYVGNGSTLNKSFWRISTVSGTTTIYYLKSSDDVWTALTGNGTSLTAAQFSTTLAENVAFLVNGTDQNRYIDATLTSLPDAVITATAPSGVAIGSALRGHLYNSPIANKIKYYKNKLYVADYKIGSIQYKNGIMHSSEPLGIVTLVDGDHATSVTTLNVTDAKYVHATDFLDVYRGTTQITAAIGDSTTQFDITNPSGSTIRYTWDTTGTDPLISTRIVVGTELAINAQNFAAGNNGTFIIAAVSGNTFDITNANGVAEINKTIGTGSIKINNVNITAKSGNSLTITPFPTAINSADELWVSLSYTTKTVGGVGGSTTGTGQRIFRWADAPDSGAENIKLYDTFKISGDPNNAINMLEDIGNLLTISSANALSVWNGSSLIEFSPGFGCVSKKGYVKNLGTLFFIHYGGVYAMTGDGAPQLISSKVEEYFTGATKAGLDTSAVGKKDKSVLFSIGTVTLYNEDDSTKKTLSNVVLEYDMRKQNWYVHTGIAAFEFATYISSSNPDRLQFTDASTFNVNEFLLERDDNDVEIPFNIETNDLYLSTNFEKFSYPRYLIIQIDAGNNIQPFTSLDGKPFFALKETVSKGCTIVKITPRSEDEKESRCRRIAIALRESSKGRVKVSRLAVLYEDADEEVLHSA